MMSYSDGDVRAFEELFRRYEAVAYGFFLASAGSPDRARDLYQELFLRIHRARDSYDPARPFKPWFFQIARRLLIDDAQRAFRSHEIPINGWVPQSDEAGSEQRLGNREQVHGLLGRLSAEERYAVVAAKVEGMSYSELAEQLHKSAGAVKKMVSRALQRMRVPAGDSVVVPGCSGRSAAN